MLKQSGSEEQFETGAIRDNSDNKSRPDLISPFAEERLGEWLRLGAIRYSERNWERGMPMSRTLASLNRHLMWFKQGKKDEDHLSAIMFNAMALIHYEEMIKRGVLPKELDDIHDIHDIHVIEVEEYQNAKSWKELLKVAYEEAVNSPDPSTQNAALLVNDGVIVLKAVNEFPIGVEYTNERWEKPLKYKIIEHAERHVIYKAARQGVLTDGLTMVSPWAACSNCARAIIQAGIKCLVRHKDAVDRSPEFWAQDIEIADQMLKEAGVEILDYNGKIGGAEVRHSGQIWSS